MNRFKKISLLFSLYIIFPIIAIEVFSQFFHRNGYLYNAFDKINKETEKITSKNKNKSILKKLHDKNLDREENFQTIYGDPNVIKNIRFRTDKFGTIYPSTLTANLLNIKNSVLFCGGSTTETYAVPEGKRIPDVFTFYSGISSINASRSGKDLEECISTISTFLKEFEEPKFIIISSNANALMNFGFQFKNTIDKKTLIEDRKKNKNLFMYNSKRFTKKIIPGNYKNLFILKTKFKKNFILKNPTNINYEKSLLAGCCYGPSTFNDRNNGFLISFDWEDENLQEEYRKYVSKTIEKLETILLKNSINKNKILFFIEPNSFQLDSTKIPYDYKQYLFNFDGEKLNGKESAKLINNYDLIYKESVRNYGFKILEINQDNLKPDFFYDAIHYTLKGSEHIGKYYSDNLNF